MNSFSVVSNSLSDTDKIAEIFASVVSTGDIIILEGDLGTGKTHFVKGVAKALNYSGKVTSPTFNIAFFYETETTKIIHLDLYRIDDIKEFNDLGLTEYFDESIVFIEWGEKIQETFDDFLMINMEYFENNKRKIIFSAKGQKNLEVIEKIKHRFQNL